MSSTLNITQLLHVVSALAKRLVAKNGFALAETRSKTGNKEANSLAVLKSNFEQPNTYRPDFL
jgi:hypothetical protein